MCAPQLTGADLYALCADAWMAGLKRCIRELEGGDVNVSDEQPASGPVVVSQEDFLVALQNLVPSLSLDDVLKYERIRDSYGSKG